MKKIATILLCSVVLLVIWAFNYGSKGPQPQLETKPSEKLEFYTVTGNVTAGFATDATETKEK